ncbi:MAG: PhzF family phenazine biosynthesis protein [Xanthobacteraceae bacterium]|nr:PhzF family phenazine biosynthesis protein [Xanthobacteraceae bacterium]PWB58674.1 MAG: phenazine biosynthesis protein PhzF [Bradyrhizobiaceae bacterium]
MKRRFVTLDVFTDRRFVGNPLAVVLEAEGLDTATMQTIAREFNHPETVFVLPAADAAHRAKLRIFTPAAELPFAGHPTVGTAVLIGRLDGGTPRDFVLEEGIGPVHCAVEQVTAEGGRARFDLPRLPAPAEGAPCAVDAAAALGLEPGDIGFDGFAPASWSAGMGFPMIPVAGLAAIARCRPDPARFEQVFGVGGPGKAYAFCRETAEPGRDFHARMFAPGMGIPEDPATGAAAAAFAGMIAGRLGDGAHRVRIEQGYEMGRPSLIELALTIRDGRLAAAAIGGGAVVATEGTIEA